MKYYKSDITGNLYSKKEYLNHGYGGIKYEFKDLPKDEYPYSEIELTQEEYEKELNKRKS